MNQTSKNVEKPNFGPDFGPFGPNLGSQRVFLLVLPLLVITYCSRLYHPIKFKGKLMNQT